MDSTKKKAPAKKKATTKKPAKDSKDAAKAEQIEGLDQKKVNETALASAPSPALMSLEGVDSEIVDRIEELRESLESFDNLRLPVIKITKDGFVFLEGEEPVDSFTGVMIFTKQSNVYYQKAYRSGNSAPPDCYSSDGRIPDADVEKPQHTNCKSCPYNQFGSSPNGEGKACKNTRPTFFLVGGSLLPMVLRIPPTSLKNIQKYVMSVASRHGSYFAVRTVVSTYKEQQEQEYLHIKFAVDGKVPLEVVRNDEGDIIQLGKKEVKGIRAETMPLMKSGNFGIDEEDATEPVKHPDPPAPSESEPGAVPQF